MSIAEKFEIIADEVFEKGKEKEWNDFWDVFQSNGTRTDYAATFKGAYWNNNTFKPKHTMTPTNADSMFHSTTITDGELLRGKVDFSKDTSGYSIFFNSKIQTLPFLDFSSVSSLNSTFGYCVNLTEIETLKLNDGGTTSFSTGCFNSTINLQKLIIQGTIGQNISLATSPKLTVESIIGNVATDEQIAEGKNILDFNGVKYYGGIFTALKDYSGTTTTRTCSLHANVLARLTDEQKAIAIDKGWTLA